MQVVIPNRKKGFSYRVAVRRRARRAKSVMMLGQEGETGAEWKNPETGEIWKNPDSGESWQNPDL
jgi:hypothetical protein